MMPLVNTTQQFIATQPSLVATALPGTIAIRPANNAVAPSVSNAQVANERTPDGSYTKVASSPATSQTAPTFLAEPIPATFSTSSASLNASAMFATQAMAQGAEPDSFMRVYEQLQAFSEVKYKPSNAAVPTEDPSNLFNKLAEQERGNSERPLRLNIQQQSLQAASQPAISLTPQPGPPKILSTGIKKQEAKFINSETQIAINSYSKTSRQNALLGGTLVEEVENISS